MITEQQILDILNLRESNIDGGETLGIHCIEYGNIAKAILKLQSETAALPVPDAPNKKKPFIVANVRDILDQYDPQSDESISYSRMVELFNEVALKWMAEHRYTLEDMGKAFDAVREVFPKNDINAYFKYKTSEEFISSFKK